MSTHNIDFMIKLEKIIPNYHQILLLNKSSDYTIIVQNEYFWKISNVQEIEQSIL